MTGTLYNSSIAFAMLESWVSIKRKKGDIPADEDARRLIEQFGDEPLPDIEAKPQIKLFALTLLDRRSP